MLDKKQHQFISTCLKSENFQANQIAGDASNRIYHRVIEGQRSYILMVWEAFENIDNYPFLNIQAHFQKAGIQVPDIIGLSPENGLVLLEDLGDLTLERKFWEFQNQEFILPHYKLAIDELIKIHFKVTDKNCIAHSIAFDEKKLMWEMNYGKTHLLKNLCQFNTDYSALEKEFHSICTTLSEQTRRVCHRDYHSRNLMIKLGKMRVIDFQDARMGPIQYDLVSLLHDSYVGLSPQSIKLLLDDYLEKAKEHLEADFSRQQFDEVFELQTLQRCFKACGSFASFFNDRKDRRYLKYIAPSLSKLHASLSLSNKFPHFKKSLEDSGALEKNYAEL